MSKYFHLSLMAVLLTVVACSPNVTKDQDSYFYSVPVGSKLHLKQEIIIKANLGRTYFQYGKAVKKKDLNLYYPHCSITINTLSEGDTIIKPATFEIYKVVDDEQYTQRHIMYASIASFDGDGGSDIVGYVSHYYLRSDSEPDVRTLECLQWNSRKDVEYLSINEVRNVLGNIFDLELNE